MSNIPKLGTKDQLPPNDTATQQTGRNGLVTFYPTGIDQDLPAVISINGDNGGIDIGGTREKHGKLLLRDKWMTITYIIDGELGETSQSGDIVLYDADGNERVRISGKTADLTLKSPDGGVIAHLDGKVGDLTLGGQGEDGDLIVRNEAGNNTIRLDGSTGNITAGGDGQDGDLLVKRGDGTQTIALDGDTGDITMSGELVIKDWAIAVPDHVFAAEYRLPGLDEVARYVGINRHLPDIPPAREVAKQGVNVGEFCMLLLKKVEEMTLYAINQERAIQQQSARLAELEQKLSG